MAVDFRVLRRRRRRIAVSFVCVYFALLAQFVVIVPTVHTHFVAKCYPLETSHKKDLKFCTLERNSTARHIIHCGLVGSHEPLAAIFHNKEKVNFKGEHPIMNFLMIYK